MEVGGSRDGASFDWKHLKKLKSAAVLMDTIISGSHSVFIHFLALFEQVPMFNRI
jgi:hypothetical protein